LVEIPYQTGAGYAACGVCDVDTDYPLKTGQTKPDKGTNSVTLKDKPFGKDNPLPRLVTSRGN
jgi:hypothetical protein